MDAHHIHLHDENCGDMGAYHKLPSEDNNEELNEHGKPPEDLNEQLPEHSGTYPGMVRKDGIPRRFTP